MMAVQRRTYPQVDPAAAGLVRRALACLPSREAEILLLKYTEEWSYQQIADQLGLTTSAVEARLHRARQRMRRKLAALDPSLAATNH